MREGAAGRTSTGVFTLPPSLVSALLILVQDLLPQREAWPRTTAEALALTGAGRSQTYEVLRRLRALLPSVLHKPGPRPSPGTSHDEVMLDVVLAVRDYLQAHPGAACGNGERACYSDAFRGFVVDLAGPGQAAQKLSVAELAFATGVPLGTLKDWLRTPPAPRTEGPATTGSATPSDPTILPAIRNTHCNTHLRFLATQWPAWRGSFKAFCRSMRAEHQLPYGDTFVGNFLQAVGLRDRRSQLPVEAPWSSGTFRQCYPGVQWLGDGTSVAVQWGEERFVFNVEAVLDVATTAMVGLKVTDTEDEEAVRLAYHEAKTTTGASPLAFTLDNRPSNHSPGAVAATAGTTLLRSTPGRGQSKAPVEGAFGLFRQAIPPLQVTSTVPREQARQMLELVLTAWARGRNGRPRKKLDDRSPVEAYRQHQPNPQDVQEARAWLAELHRRQQQAQKTRQARRDPVRLTLLAEGLEQLHIADPDGRLATALAGYDREAIVGGLAAFQGKQSRQTLPPDADPGRYLGGIIRQLHTRLELEDFAQHILEQRLRLGDLTLEPLHRELEQLQTEVPPDGLAKVFVDRCLLASSAMEADFWACSATTVLSRFPTPQRNLLYRSLSRRVAATFKADRRRRADLIDRLAQVTAPP